MKKFNWLLTLVLALALNVAYAKDTTRKVATDADALENEIIESNVNYVPEKIQKCINRVRESCTLSNNDVDRIGNNVVECKQLKSKKGTTVQELFLLADAGKLVVVTTKSAAGQTCSRTKYSLGFWNYIQEIKIIRNHAWMYTNNGRVYFMNPDESFVEVYSSSGKPYAGVRDIKGDSGGQNIILIMKNGQDVTMDRETLAKRKKVPVEFSSVPTNRSLFRDE
ncbi:MAG: hypothetical protein HYW49_00135 [Deltaproteobacteria bacterium]|nr:hypothetical protein [Deltaproteobacteria bacterium]